jgi:alpha-tubulin suppressor-like RCC1 family protein
LGHGDKENLDTPKLVESLSEYEVIYASCGLWHTVVVCKNGKVFSWGNSTYGQLGHGDTETELNPKEISFLSDKNIKTVSCGSSHCASITSSGEIYTWGNGGYGQMGNNKKENCNKPKLLILLISENCAQISCGQNHTMALMSSGKVYSWGAGIFIHNF